MALADINSAARDGNLLERLTAAAASKGVPNPQQWVEQNRFKLVTHKVDEEQTISDVFAYAVATATPPPGANPSAVTDNYLLDAVDSLLAE